MKPDPLATESKYVTEKRFSAEGALCRIESTNGVYEPLEIGGVVLCDGGRHEVKVGGVFAGVFPSLGLARAVARHYPEHPPAYAELIERIKPLAGQHGEALLTAAGQAENQGMLAFAKIILTALEE